MALGKPIAEGRTAEIYPWDDGFILKLFHPWVSEDSVRYEASINHAVYTAGLSVPQVGELIEINGRVGLVYQRLHGKTMDRMMASKPWMLVRFATQLAELQFEMHKLTAPPDIPNQSERLAQKISAVTDLEFPLRNALLRELERMPKDNQLCHGDFHPGNLMVGDDMVVIDWVDATSGAPMADVARTSILLKGVSHMSTELNWLVRVYVGFFHRIYVKKYFALCPDSVFEYRKWLPIVAAGRMSENIPGLNIWLRNQVLSGLNA